MTIDANKRAILLERFQKMDKDKSGYLDRQEIIAGFKELGMKQTAAEIDAIIAKADKNQDGKIQFEEFLDMM